MSTLGQDRGARLLLGGAFGSAALLVLVSAWSTGGDALEHWARARWTLAPLGVCLIAAVLCGWGAWRRRAAPALWVPLLGGTATALAAALASVGGKL